MTLNLESCSIRLDARTISRGEHVGRLTGTEAELLRYLSSRPGEVLSREELYREVWKHQTDLQTRTLDLTILRLRKKIELDPRNPTHVLSVYGVGYRFVPLHGTAETVAETAPSEASTNLGREESAFFGREAEQNLLDQLVNGGQGWVTVVGPPGTGKTRLVKHWAAKRLERDANSSAWFCDLTEVATEQGVLQAVATAVQASLPEEELDATTVEQAVGQRLERLGPTLVLIDNAEQVVEWIGPLLRGWWERARAACFVVTSQVPLGLPMEQRMSLPPLPLPEREGGAELTDNPAVQLFVNRAQRVQPTFEPTEEQQRDISAIVVALDGLPLAIELAAARIHLMPPATLRERMAQRFRVLRRPKQAGPERHATLQAALDWSWSLLSPWEQAALAQCSVFRGGFDWDGAEGVIDVSAWPEAPWAVDVVAELVERSLVMVHEGPGGECRLSLLVSIGAYASLKLLAVGEDAVEATERRHAEYYAAVRERTSVSSPRRNVAALPDVENLIAAVQRSVQRNWAHCAVRACTSVMVLMDMQGFYGEALALGRRVLTMECSVEQRSEMSHNSAWLLFKSGQLEQANEAFDRDIAFCRTHGLRVQLGRGLDAAASVLRALGRLDEAHAYYEQALAIAQDMGNQRAIAVSYGNLGNSYRALNRVEDALAMYDKALSMFREADNRRMMATCLSNVALLQRDMEDFDGAHDTYHQALPLAKEVGLAGLVASILAALGYVSARKGDLSAAVKYLDEGEELLRGMENTLELAATVAQRGLVACLAGDRAAALHALEEAEALAQDLKVTQSSGLALEIQKLRKAIDAQAPPVDS